MDTEIDREGHDGSETEAESAAETTTDTEVDADTDIGVLDEGEWVGARHLLYDMISTPSVSGDEEAAVEVLKAFFEAHGREFWIDEVGDVRAPADDAVLLTSHVDAIPGDVSVKVEGGVLWGHGSVDTTSPLCTMAMAAVRTGVSFVGVVGEETSSHGVWHLMEDHEEPNTVVNSEPSGWDGITLGYRGFLSGTYIPTNELGHSSRPEENVIQSVVAWWSRATNFFDEDRDGIFDTVTTKPVTFDGGPTEDGLAVEATVGVQFRVPPQLSIDDVREVAESELTRGGIHWNKPVPSVVMGPRTSVARAFRVAIRNIGGVKPRLLRRTGTSDVNIFAGTWDRPMTVYDPGDSDLDYAPNEHLDLAEFDSTIGVLTDVYERLTDN